MNRTSKNAKHFDILINQAVKHGQDACGDFVLNERDGSNTYVVLCDGIGSGAYAHVSAVMCANRMMTLMKAHMDLKTLGHKIAAFMKRARTEESFPFAAFCAVSLAADGRFRAVTYENPEPLFLEHTTVSRIEQTFTADSGEVVGVCTGMMSSGDTLFMMSDGVTQAGMGEGYGFGWGSDGFLRWVNDQIQQKKSIQDILNDSAAKVREMCGGTHRDDATLIAIKARPARILNILSGPPESKAVDERFVKQFDALGGKKVICGSTTADIYARVTGKQVKTQFSSNSISNPPKYEIAGIDLVTEGALTLNQSFNILDMDAAQYDELNTVTELSIFLKEADRVNFLIGGARNAGNEGLTFKQLGVLPRRVIIELIAKKLDEAGVQTDISYY